MRIPAIILICTSLWACGGDTTEQAEVSVTPEKRDLILDSLNSLIFQNTNDADLYLSRATHFRELGNIEAALSDLKRVFRIDSTNTGAFLVNGQMMFELQDYKNAYESYKRCVELHPENADCLLEAAYMESILENHSQAIVYINRALKQNNYIPRAYYLKGQVYKQTGDSLLAASSYQTATELDPDYYDAFIALGVLYAASNNDLAEEYYNSALVIEPDNTEALYNKALFLQETGFRDTSRYTEAFDLYNRILEIDPRNAAAAFNQGYIYLEYFSADDDEAYQKGIDWFSKALEVYPMYYQAVYNRGLCHESLNMLDRAERDYRKALAIQPDYTPAAIALERVIEEQR